jgi:UDP-N-acetylmuramate--alanine ligase
MNVYFSGLGGVGIGPLTEIARDAGETVMGSDLAESLLTQELQQQGVNVHIGQDGSFLQACHDATPLDWFVYTAALPKDHPELLLAQKLGIRTGKRDEFLAAFIEAHTLKLIAISGTHGKTTTTGMFVWALKQLGVPMSYSVGSTLSFGPSGAYNPDSTYFIYECDEYDRNFLHFFPTVSLLTSVDYDHPDTYPTEDSYRQAFQQYIAQSDLTIGWRKDLQYIEPKTNAISSKILELDPSEVAAITVTGEHNRRNATLVYTALQHIELAEPHTNAQLSAALENFPGTDRRFEKLADNLYSDYGHHPEEIAATLQLARELSDHVVLVYQPHQNWRQHFIRDQYTNQFDAAEKIYWLPTYLTRENPSQPTLSAQELTVHVTNKSGLEYARLDENLWNKIQQHRNAGYLVLCMGAGTIDEWVRNQLTK